MREDDFNLILQPWIRVRASDASVTEVSMLELFQNAHTYRALSGELPTQDVAILRVLLAVLHTVFSRVDPDGAAAPLEEADCEDECLDRWQALWEKKRFPMEPIKSYLHSVEDRFWLFDKERPFYQFPAAKTIGGTDAHGALKEPYSVAKLNGEICQSGNKISVFAGRSGEEKYRLSYSAAARWLIHLVGYDDCALKKSAAFKDKEKKTGKTTDESPGVGWLGKLGAVYAEGDNLFETLMLNLVMDPQLGHMAAAHQRPLWEDEQPVVREREKVPQPDNLAQLLTFPSRQLLLERADGFVTGYYSVFGMFFDAAAPIEQMTCRKGPADPKDSPYMPARHKQEVFLWREFDSLFVSAGQKEDCRPGIVRWIDRLQAAEDPLIDEKKVIRFRSTGIYYVGNPPSAIRQIEADGLSIQAGLVSNLGNTWRQVISEELSYTDRVADAVGQLAQDIYIAASGRRGKEAPAVQTRSRGRARMFEAMDLPFRDWLRSIAANDPDTEGKRAEWREQVLKTARRIGHGMAEEAGPAAYTGHLIREKDGKAGKFYSSAKASTDFERRLYFIK